MPPPRRSSKSVWQTAISQGTWRAVGLSFAVHLGIALLLFVGLKWQLESPGPLQVELWTDGNTTEVASAPEQPEPQPEPAPEPQPEPEPEPAPEPAPPAPPPPPPPPEPDIAAREAEIALEQQKELERQEQARLEAERIAREQAQREEQERQARLAAELKAKQEAERKARAEAERQAKLEQERREKEEAQKRAEQERQRQAKLQAEQQAKAEAERKTKEEAERKARAEAELKAKAEAERKAKAEAERKAKEAAAAREQALRDAFRNDVRGVTGISGGTAASNQRGGGADAGYAGQIRACIQPNVSFPTPVRSGNTNPTAVFRVQLKSDGTVSSTSLSRSSGNTAFDRAVDNGIRRCSPFPKPPSGRYPSYIDVNYQMYD